MEEDDVIDAPVEVLGGQVQGASGVDAVSGLLLELAAATAKLAILLNEANEEEFKALRGRLSVFLSLVQQLPTDPRPRRKMGFKAPKKRKPRGRKQ